jgi:hypothetical protein
MDKIIYIIKIEMPRTKKLKKFTKKEHLKQLMDNVNNKYKNIKHEHINKEKIHKILNRIDVEKDAKHTKILINNYKLNLFHTYADRLFDQLPDEDYNKSYKFITNSIDDIYKIPPVHIIISRYVKPNIISIPLFIQIGVQDAGPSPKQFNNSSREELQFFYGCLQSNAIFHEFPDFARAIKDECRSNNNNKIDIGCLTQCPYLFTNNV